jgi:hypothetical protein
MVKVDQEVDRLYSLQIEEFVAARNELSRRLKNEGDTSAADEVEQLVKPNVAAWTINQLSRQLGPIKDSFSSPIGELRGWSAAMPAALDGRADVRVGRWCLGPWGLSLSAAVAASIDVV